MAVGTQPVLLPALLGPGTSHSFTGAYCVHVHLQTEEVEGPCFLFVTVKRKQGDEHRLSGYLVDISACADLADMLSTAGELKKSGPSWAPLCMRGGS